MNRIWNNGEFTPIAQVTMYMLSLILGLSGFAYIWIVNQ